MKTIENVDLKGKTVFMRADLNSPYDEKTGKIETNERIKAHAQSVKQICSKGAKLVVLAHQGRKGDPDCISLSQHAQILSRESGIKVKFVDDVCGEKAKSAINSLKPGEAILLDNVRFLDDETKFKTTAENANAQLVRELKPLCNYFVLDAFSVAHRAQASVVGFAAAGVPTLAGPVMAAELRALEKLKSPARPAIFVFGGAKPEDSISILEQWLNQGKLDSAICCGVLGTLFLEAKGIDIGASKDFLEKSGAINFLPTAQALLQKYPGKIMIPTDVALDNHGKRQEIPVSRLPSDLPIFDIGSQTAKAFSAKLASAKTVVVNGPAGVYEKEEFSAGTRAVLTAIANSKAFSVAGGGHTITAIGKFGLDKKKFGYISLSGKALIEYLSGKELPGVKILS
ncbi:Phosphoglycerate kinase [Candidatus Gugararchaeum adminiculabundum]|nr:Phosphoglycerate kinase [Candidatus Gugararchaeum adminiculabundum]